MWVCLIFLLNVWNPFLLMVLVVIGFFDQVKVWLGDNADHYYVLSRFLLSRMLTVTKVDNPFADSPSIYTFCLIPFRIESCVLSSPFCLIHSMSLFLRGRHIRFHSPKALFFFISFPWYTLKRGEGLHCCPCYHAAYLMFNYLVCIFPNQATMLITIS